MNNESKENKRAVVRGRGKNARTALQSLKSLTVTNKITNNQQYQQTKGDSDSSMSRDKAEFQSLMQESQNKVVTKPKSEKEMKKGIKRCVVWSKEVWHLTDQTPTNCQETGPKRWQDFL